MKRGMEMSTSPQGKTKTIYRTISAKNILKIFEAQFEKKFKNIEPRWAKITVLMKKACSGI